MADLTTYAGLKQAVIDYLGREDLSDRVPTFISLAEKRMNRDLRLRVMEKRAHTVLTAGTSRMPLPFKRVDGSWDVFLAMRDLVWIPDNGTPINVWYATPDEYAVEQEKTGPCSHFTIIGNELFLLPAPDTDGDLFLTYYAEIPPLSDTQTDNEILLTAPDLYLYAALVEAVPWTRGSVPGKDWQNYYQEARNRVQRAEQSARYPVNASMRPCRRI